jgi:hypothetical protein
MAIMHVSLVELFRQAVMGWILALECVLPSTRGLLQLRPVLLGS